MLHNLIQTKKSRWLQSSECMVKPLLDYIRNKAELRDAQIEAIETYLFLKLAGNNKPLADLFAEGFFLEAMNLGKIRLDARTRETLEQNIPARALFQLARMPNGGASLLPELERAILEDSAGIDYPSVIRQIFYNIDYADYLFSLPMGAGKTFLIAALIYLDLYFARNEPDNPLFAHNFLVLAPSGLKSSIVPSLKTIERFDPSWVLPEPAASDIKRLVRFEILDQPKSAKRSNRARNPNAQKVNALISEPDPMGLVFVVNAEKVILERLELGAQMELIEKTEDEQDRAANELRHLIGQIPHLAIHIDEVHHATSEDIKLRRVVSEWSRNGVVTAVLGYSGTPYLPDAEKIAVNDRVQLRFKQITNTVYYYPLIRAIRRFLKKPIIQTARNLEPLEIIRRGAQEFYQRYGDTVYQNGARAKLAIYCGSIPRLEEEILPFLVRELSIHPDDILKYHRGNKDYKIAPQDEIDFASLDLPVSKKRIILLVQVGKEGWDCRSLTGVILAQKGDSPTNMVLQTSCRCLRQVDKGQNETALIWLNSDNEKILDKQLSEEQQTSVAEVNSLSRDVTDEVIRRSRMAHLNLSTIDFYQLRIDYDTLVVSPDPQTALRLDELAAKLGQYKSHAQVQTEELVGEARAELEVYRTDTISETQGERARLDFWLAEIARESLGTLSLAQLDARRSQLAQIFEMITSSRNGARCFNALYDRDRINARIRLAFSARRQLETRQEVVPKRAELLLVAELDPVKKHAKLYPTDQDAANILKYDKTHKTMAELDQMRQQENQRRQASFQPDPNNPFAPAAPDLLPPFTLAVKSKDQTFHYLPYDFKQSGFEKVFLEACLTLDVFQDRQLEIYYNGERGLTEFVIQCYAQEDGFWKNVGRYTTDFLILQRKADRSIYKALLVETKGSGFESQPEFKKKKRFVETDFLRINRAKFGYAYFDFIFLRDEDPPELNLELLRNKIVSFFAAPEALIAAPAASD